MFYNKFSLRRVFLFPKGWIPIILMLPVILFTAGCSEQKANAGFSMPPMPAEVAQVIEQKVADKFEAVGTIEASKAITVVSEIDAAVTSLPFEEGNQIKSGELIAQLDDSQLSAEVIRTEAIYSQSQSTYNRVKKIVEQNAGTPQDLDDAYAALKVAEANLKLAQARLAKAHITAPFDGIIGARKVSIGTFLRSGQAIAELANLDEIRVGFSAPERFLSQLKRGAEVFVSSPAFPGHEVKGRIIAIEPIIDSETRSARIVARVQNPGQKFRSGMSANITVILNERAAALTIPSESIFANGDQSFVYIVNTDNTVKRAAIKTGLQLANAVEITEGLEQGMKVIRAGHQKLFEGAKVVPINSQETVAKQ